MEHVRIKKDLIILLLISGVVLFWSLGSGSLASWDEAIYANISNEIIKSNNWIDLTHEGVPWNDKPPLYMWITAFFYTLFGVTEFSARLLSVLCGVGTILCTYLLGNKLYSRKTAISASLILLTSWQFIWSSRMGTLDIAMTFFMILSFLLFLYGEKSKIALFLCPLSFAGAFYIKSMGALLIPIILLIFIISARKYKLLATRAFIFGAIVASILILWWHLLAWAHYGDGFINDYFVKHLVTRTTNAIDGHTGDIFTYIGVIPNKGRPWGGVGLILLPLAAWRIFRNNEKMHLLPVIWVSTVFVIFSLVKTKLIWYVVPLYPPLAIISGWGISKLLNKHTIKIVSVLASISLIYLAIDKNIFDLDRSPTGKRVSTRAINTVPEDKTLYIYSIGDPSMQFYAGREGKFIVKKSELLALGKNKDIYILTTLNHLPSFPLKNFSVVFKEDHYALIKTD